MKRTLKTLFGILILLTGCELKDPMEPGTLVPKTVDEDPSLPSIVVNGTQLHSESYGDPNNPMVVVIHGGPGSDYRSLLNCKNLANDGYFVIFYDQRGSGLSKRESKSVYTSQIMYDDLSGVIAHYRTSPQQKVFLLGHSWGAMLATAYINMYPLSVDGAILSEPGGFIWKDIMDYIGRTQSYGFTSENLSDVAYLDQFITKRHSEQEIMDYKMGLTAVTDGNNGNILGNEDYVPFWRFGAVINEAMGELGDREQPDWTTHLSAFTTKVLFMYSENNKAYGPDHALLVSSAYPNTELVRIDGAGHDMFTFTTGWNNSYPYILNYLNELK